jgi:hypothetical protein
VCFSECGCFFTSSQLRDIEFELFFFLLLLLLVLFLFIEKVEVGDILSVIVIGAITTYKILTTNSMLPLIRIIHDSYYYLFHPLEVLCILLLYIRWLDGRGLVTFGGWTRSQPRGELIKIYRSWAGVIRGLCLDGGRGT